MTTFQVRNRKTKMVLGEVTVGDPAKVLDELMDATGCSVEEIAASLGSTVEEAKAALDIVKVGPKVKPTSGRRKAPVPSLTPRRLFA